MPTPNEVFVAIQKVKKNVPSKHQSGGEGQARQEWEKTLTGTCMQFGVVCQALQIAQHVQRRSDVRCGRGHDLTGEFMSAGDIIARACPDYQSTASTG
jgi:hypothetical protein